MTTTPVARRSTYRAPAFQADPPRRTVHATPARRGVAARRRFVQVWAARWQRNAPAFVGGAASITLAGLIGAMLGTV